MGQKQTYAAQHSNDPKRTRVWRITEVVATRREGRALGDKARPAISALVFKKREPIGRGFVRHASASGRNPSPARN